IPITASDRTLRLQGAAPTSKLACAGLAVFLAARNAAALGENCCFAPITPLSRTGETRLTPSSRDIEHSALLHHPIAERGRGPASPPPRPWRRRAFADRGRAAPRGYWGRAFRP